MLTIQVNTPSQDKTVITTLGTAALSKYVERNDAGVHVHPRITMAGTATTGTISHISLELMEGEVAAQNSMSFTGVPTAYSTVTIDTTVYTFIPATSGITAVNQVPLGGTAFSTANNFYKVLTATGTSGTDYHASQTTHTTVGARYLGNPLYLYAKTLGVAGNAIVTTTTDASVIITYDKMYDGGTATNKVLSYQELPWAGNTTYDFDPVSYHPCGTAYGGTVRLLLNGVACVSTSGSGVTYSLVRTLFFGNLALTEFGEVPNLSGIVQTNGGMSSTGQFFVTWGVPSIYNTATTLGLSAPSTTGTPTQSTKSYTAAELAQSLDYVVFVFIGATAPQRNWPRPTDANGVWYFAGRTRKTYADITVPLTNAKAVWAGFGDKATFSTTSTKINRTIATVYLS